MNRVSNRLNQLRLVAMVIIPLFWGCENSSSRNSATHMEESDWPKPTSYIGELPVYEKFSDIEPIFHIDNDTTYVINFWATWCKPCIEELPYLEEFGAKNSNEKVKVILVSLDFPSKIESHVLPFLEKKALKSQVIVLLDGKFNDWIDKVSSEWSGAIPVTYIYKGDQVTFVNEAFEDLNDLESTVKPILASQ